MVSFIDTHRGKFGVELICRQFPIAPSTYNEQKARDANPTRLPENQRRDKELRADILRVWNANYQVYGVRKI